MTIIHMPIQFHLTKHYNHPHTSKQNCCYCTEIALVSFNHSCYWITQLSVGLCGWLSQHSAAALSDLALSDLWNKAQVTVQYCVLLPGEHFRCCPWPRETVASLALNVFVLVNSVGFDVSLHGQLLSSVKFYVSVWAKLCTIKPMFFPPKDNQWHTGCNSYSSPCCTWYYNYITSRSHYNFLTWIFPNHLLCLATV